MNIPTQRSAKHDKIVRTEERCDHVACNAVGFSLTAFDVDLILNCLVERGKLIVLPNGKYFPAGVRL